MMVRGAQRSAAVWAAVSSAVLSCAVLAFVLTQWTTAAADRDLVAAVHAAALGVEQANDPRAALDAVDNVVPAGRTAIVDPANSAALSDGARAANPGHGTVIVADGVQARDAQLGRLDQQVLIDAGTGGTWVAVTATPLDQGVAIAAALATVVAAFATVLALLLHMRRRRKAEIMPERLTEYQQTAVSVRDSEPAELQMQRQRMIRGLAELIAMLPPEFEWQAERVMNSAGVRAFVADGETFDPRIHHAVDTQPTPDAALGDTVARTLRCGWADGDRIVVPARVVVYVASAQPRVLP